MSAIGLNDTWKTVVEQLRSRGVTIAIPLVFGDMLEGTLDELAGYIEDRQLFNAQYLGMTKEESREFCTTDGTIQCSGTTAAGNRCKNTLMQVLLYDPESWLKRKRNG